MSRKSPGRSLYDISQVKDLAIECGWQFLTYQQDVFMLSFTKLHDTKGKMRINIYCSRKTVATSLTHPKQGKTQLYRKDCSMNDLRKIFSNPRVHTKKGYKTL